MRTGTTTHRGAWRRSTLALGAAVALTTSHLSGALAAPAAPAEPGIELACDERARTAGAFVDVASDLAHAGAIDCLWVYGIVHGRTTSDGTHFEPTLPVTRQQMASFIANTLDRLPDRSYALPAARSGGPRFADAHRISTPHRVNVDRLQQAGIVAGFGDGTFRPGDRIDRAQMATFLVRALEAAVEAELPRTATFGDVGGAHEESIDKLASVGIARGSDGDRFDPSAAITRGQMASFVARSIGYLVAEEALVPVAFARSEGGGELGVTGIDIQQHAGVDRVTFDVSGADGTAGWHARYVDQAIEHGSGRTIELDGSAIIEVVLTGMGLPFELDEDLWDDDRIVIGGDGIVEIVNRQVYEGRHQFFVGTTGLHPFVIDRDTDGAQRIHLEVDHSG
jgi:hypothetical protein